MPRKIRQLKADLHGKTAMNNQHLHYSMVIEWSLEDQAFLVTLPEWADRNMMPATHGKTYDEAVKHGREVLQMLVNEANEEGQPLPLPKVHAI